MLMHIVNECGEVPMEGESKTTDAPGVKQKVLREK